MSMNQSSPSSQGQSSSKTHPFDDALKTMYQELTTGYQNIEDFRSKLLGFLPFVTGSSFVVTIISDPSKNRALMNLVLPFGLLGAFVTLGFLCYEIENIKRLEMLAKHGRGLERQMNLVGFFARETPSFFNDYHAADLIYFMTFAGWVCIALWFVLPGKAIFVAVIVLVVSILLGLPFMKQVRKHIVQNLQTWSAAVVFSKEIV